MVTIDPDGEPAARDLLSGLSALQRAVGSREPEGRLSCVAGVGSEAWDGLFAGPRPAGPHPCRELVGATSEASVRVQTSGAAGAQPDHRTRVWYTVRVRTLMTQMRVQRLVRMHAAEVARLRDRPFDRTRREAAVRQLLDQVRNIRRGWLAELAAAAPAGPGGVVERQVTRRIVALEAATATLARPSTDLERARTEFEDAAVPLLLMLRGLDGYAEASLGATALSRSA